MHSGNGVPSILVVEDEKKLARSLEKQLSREGFNVDLAFDGTSALDKVNSRKFNIIILDLNLPKKSGYEVLTDIRTKANLIPVLILSARGTVDDRIKGLREGADDYVMKPFDTGELFARIEAILRRSKNSNNHILKAGDLIVHLTERKVQRNGKEITLSPREFALLEYFLKNKNQILTRKRIAEQVWGYHFDTGTNLVDVYVYYLRESADKGFPKKLIHTVRGEGFMLVDK